MAEIFNELDKNNQKSSCSKDGAQTSLQSYKSVENTNSNGTLTTDL